MKKKFEFKSRFVVVLCIIALFIPTYIAVASYLTADKAPVKVSTVDKMYIDDLAGMRYTLDSEKNADIIGTFNKINTDAISIGSLPEPLADKNYFIVTFVVGTTERKYSYYFAADDSGSYFLDYNNNPFKIKDEDAALFTGTSYAASLYETAKIPVLTVGAAGAKIAPTAMDWIFLNNKKVQTKAFASLAPSNSESYSIDGGFSLAFSNAPDTALVTVSRDGTQIYTGTLANMQLDTGSASYKILLQAEWLPDDTRGYQGKATYEFVANITAAAEFYLGKPKAIPGNIVAITAYNVTDPTQITFSSEPALTYNGKEIKPVFTADGDHALALLPINYDCAEGTVKLTFGYGSTSQTTELIILGKAYGNAPFTTTSAVLNEYRTEGSLASFAKVRADLNVAGTARMWNDGIFNDGVGGVNASRGFGKNVTINSNKALTYINEGVDYNINKGSKVVAIAKGTVVYSGVLDYPGKFVVVDHGCGMKSWYLHLGDVSVKVGDVVEAEAQLGTAGNTGFVTTTSMVSVMMTVGEVPVSPYQFWTDTSRKPTELTQYEYQGGLTIFTK